MANGKPRDPQGRSATDQGLQTEREKTDLELANRSEAIRGVAHDVVAKARDKADAVLGEARDREDLKLVPAGSGGDVRRARAREDAVVESARSGADAVARDESERQHIALASLLAFEREHTDLRLETERARADEALTSREDFMAMVSHDLRTLLGGIALSAELLKELGTAEVPPLPKVITHAERIQRFTGRMNRLVGDLMDMASIEAGKLALVRVCRNAGLLLRDSMDAFGAAASGSGIELAIESAVEPALVELDHERILQVLSNLVSNALKYTPRGGRITIRLDRRGNNVCFSVTDTGKGIPPELHAKIFERYFQSANGDRRGLGLGLFIAKSIVEGHGGSIWVESTPGIGSQFHFTLPAVEVASAR